LPNTDCFVFSWTTWNVVSLCTYPTRRCDCRSEWSQMQSHHPMGLWQCQLANGRP